MLADIDVAPVAESIRSEWEIERSDLEPPSEQEEFPKIPTKVQIVQCAIDNIRPVPADPALNYEPIPPFQHVPAMDVLPMSLSKGNTDYRAALRAIVNCQELIGMFQNNE
jgi:hypothetical protein